MDAFGTRAPIVNLVGGDPPRPRRQPGRWLMIGVCAVAAAGFTACLVSVYAGMRDVIKTSGPFCASGGPYVIAHRCSASDTRLLFIGVLGMLVSGAIFAGVCAWADGPVLVPGLLMWSGLFGALGWNFIDLRGHGSVGGSGFLVSGVVFWVMAAGGLLPVLALGLGWIRRGGKPELPVDRFPMGAVVRASAHVVTPAAGPPGAQPAAAAPPIGPTRIVRPPAALP